MLYPTLWQRTPTSLFDEVFNSFAGRGVDRWFDRFFNTPFGFGTVQNVGTWMPTVDICETGDDIRLMAELPGFDPQDLNVQVENGILTITGERKHEVQEGQENANYYLRERRFGRFERSFTLPVSVAADQVQAQYHNGLLTVILPKTETAKPRRVEIQAADGKAQIGSGRRAA